RCSCRRSGWRAGCRAGRGWQCWPPGGAERPCRVVDAGRWRWGADCLARGAAALAFMLAAPAINPVVLVATAVAFPGAPMMVVGRLGASLLTAVMMGWAWARWGRPEWITRRPPSVGARTESRSV